MYRVLFFLIQLIQTINSAPANNCTEIYKTTVIDNLEELHGEYSLVYLWSPFPLDSNSSNLNIISKPTQEEISKIMKKCSFIPLVGNEIKLKITKGDKEKFMCTKYDSKFVIEDDCQLVKFEMLRVTPEFILVVHPDVPEVVELIGTRPLNEYELKCMVPNIGETMKLK